MSELRTLGSIEAAQELVVWLERGNVDRYAYIEELEVRLATLIAAILNGPEGDAPEEPPSIVSQSDWDARFEVISRSLGPAGFYWYVEPVGLTGQPEPVLALLADDLSDIWRDLTNELAVLKWGRDRRSLELGLRAGYEKSWGYRGCMALSGLRQAMRSAPVRKKPTPPSPPGLRLVDNSVIEFSRRGL